MSPQAALAAAASARSAASGRPVPGWFPTASSCALAVGLSLVGASLLADGAWRLLGVAGAVVLAGFAALWVMLAARWRRHGLIPVAPRLDRSRPPQQRRLGLAADFAAIALSVAVLAATGRLGWAAIAAGWLLAAALWYRLRSHAA